MRTIFTLILAGNALLWLVTLAKHRSIVQSASGIQVSEFRHGYAFPSLKPPTTETRPSAILHTISPSNVQAVAVKNRITGVVLNNIRKLSFFNTPKINCEISIEINPSKNILVLTGYNGSGKSRILNMIHESLSLVRNHNYSGPSMNWAADIFFDGHFTIRTIKLETDSVPTEAAKKKLKSILDKEKTLKNTYIRSKNLISPNDRTSNIVSNDEKEYTSAFGCSVVLTSKQTLEIPSSSIETVLYIDEKIHFNFKRKVVETVFDGQTGIDQALYILIHEFIATLARSNGVEENIKVLFDEYVSGRSEWNEAEAKKYVRENLNIPEVLNSSNRVESTEVFTELNSFFSMTDRRIVWRDSGIYMKVGKEGEVHWVDFSKGEKTLITLFLIAFLYRDSSTFLFDEPDLSLHMEWQKMLIPSLLKLAPRAQFIITTHSPFLVMNTNSEQIINLAKLYSEAI